LSEVILAGDENVPARLRAVSARAHFLVSAPKARRAIWSRTRWRDHYSISSFRRENWGGPSCLNRISASISGASARVRLPSGRAAEWS